MPLHIEPPPGARGVVELSTSARPGSSELVIGLINNMPDSALEGTEAQFKGLLAAAVGVRTVRLRLASLPDVPRGPAARARIADRYWSLDQLWAQPPDAIIVTGTEPKAAVLSDEPYWPRLVELVDYADANLMSSMWSCSIAWPSLQGSVAFICGVAKALTLESAANAANAVMDFVMVVMRMVVPLRGV